MVTVASRGYLERHGRPSDPRDLANHDAIHFRAPATGKPFEWIFVRNGRSSNVTPRSRVVVNDTAAGLAAGIAGVGIVQKLEIELRALRETELVELLPEWNEERFPLYLYLPSRRHPPAKVRAFADFVIAAVRA